MVGAAWTVNRVGGGPGRGGLVGTDWAPPSGAAAGSGREAAICLHSVLRHGSGGLPARGRPLAVRGVEAFGGMMISGIGQQLMKIRPAARLYTQRPELNSGPKCPGGHIRTDPSDQCGVTTQTSIRLLFPLTEPVGWAALAGKGHRQRMRGIKTAESRGREGAANHLAGYHAVRAGEGGPGRPRWHLRTALYPLHLVSAQWKRTRS